MSAVLRFSRASRRKNRIVDLLNLCLDPQISPILHLNLLVGPEDLVSMISKPKQTKLSGREIELVAGEARNTTEMWKSNNNNNKAKKKHFKTAEKERRGRPDEPASVTSSARRRPVSFLQNISSCQFQSLHQSPLSLAF